MMRRLGSRVLLSMAIVGATFVAGCGPGTDRPPTDTPAPSGTSGQPGATGDTAPDGEPEKPEEKPSGGYSY
jgi:hypothetical protein